MPRTHRTDQTAADRPDETDTPRPVAPEDAATQHLKVFADALGIHGHLATQFVLPLGKGSTLRVAAKDNPQLNEELTCSVENGRPVLLWSWGDPIYGDGLAAQAESVAYVLNAKVQVSK